MLADAQLTILRHSYLSAGPILREDQKPVGALSENYNFYFRDDRANPSQEIKWSVSVEQCREASASELAVIRSVL